MSSYFFFLMILRPPRSTRTDTLFPYTTLFRSTKVENIYWLPAATLTWNFAEDMQFRLHASKTIARPQFRELAPQQYLDTETEIGRAHVLNSSHYCASRMPSSA